MFTDFFVQFRRPLDCFRAANLLPAVGEEVLNDILYGLDFFTVFRLGIIYISLYTSRLAFWGIL